MAETLSKVDWHMLGRNTKYGGIMWFHETKFTSRHKLDEFILIGKIEATLSQATGAIIVLF